MVAVIGTNAKEADGSGGFTIASSSTSNDPLFISYYIDDAADTAEPTDYGLDDLAEYKTVRYPECRVSACYVRLHPVNDAPKHSDRRARTRVSSTFPSSATDRPVDGATGSDTIGGGSTARRNQDTTRPRNL